MTYKEILECIEKNGRYTVVEIKGIQHGKSIRLSNGGIINCFDTGAYSIQGKEQEKVKEIITTNMNPDNKKYLSLMVMMIWPEHNWKLC